MAHGQGQGWLARLERFSLTFGDPCTKTFFSPRGHRESSPLSPFLSFSLFPSQQTCQAFSTKPTPLTKSSPCHCESSIHTDKMLASRFSRAVRLTPAPAGKLLLTCRSSRGRPRARCALLVCCATKSLLLPLRGFSQLHQRRRSKVPSLALISVCRLPRHISPGAPGQALVAVY